jgi:hypothetical protein
MNESKMGNARKTNGAFYSKQHSKNKEGQSEPAMHQEELKMGETYYEAGKRDGYLALLVPKTGDLFRLWRFAALKVVVESLDE